MTQNENIQAIDQFPYYQILIKLLKKSYITGLHFLEKINLGSAKNIQLPKH